MAQITLTATDVNMQRIVDAYCHMYQYDREKLPEETRGQFTKRMIYTSIKGFVKDYETDKIVRETNINAAGLEIT